MRRLVPLLRELERQGFEGKLTNAAELSRQAGEEFERIRQFPGGLPGRALQPRRQDLTMKKILIIEDDQIVGEHLPEQVLGRRLPGGDRRRTD